MDELQLQLLDKTIASYSWSPECVQLLRAVADAAPNEFAPKMACLERWVRQSNPDAPNLAAQKELDSGQWYRLYEVIVRLDPLRDLFASKPGFSEADATVIANYASFADARPDVETVLHTTDVLFMRVLREVLGPVPPTASSILHADFTKLIMLYSAYPQETVTFLDFVPSAGFHSDWSALEQKIDLLRKKPNHADPTQQDDEAHDLAAKIIDAVPGINEPDLKSMADLLLLPPLVSTMDPRELLIFERIRDGLPKADDLLKKADNDQEENWGVEKRSSLVAKETLGSSHIINPDKLNPIKVGWELRIEAIKHFLELRRYAKLNALAYKWPRLSVILRTDRRTFFDFEKRITSSQPETAEDDSPPIVSKLIRQYGDDDTLVNFLHLRPFFREVSEQEIREFDVASSTVVPIAPSQAQMIPQLAPAAFDPLPAAIPPPEPEEYRNIHLTVRKRMEAPSDTDVAQYEVQVRSDGFDSPQEEREIVSIPASFIADLNVDLKSLPPGPVSRTFGRDAVTRDPAQAVSLLAQNRDISATLQRIGTAMYDRVFPDHGKARKHLLQALESSQKCRIILELAAPELAVLPWETIYVAEQRVFLSLIGKYSFVRYYQKTASLFAGTLQTPLKILALFSSPVDLPPLPIEQDEQVLRGALSDATERGQVELQVLPNPTINDLQRTLRAFHPHILHFDGHGTFSPDGTEGALVFEDGERRAQLVHASVLKTHLAGSGVNLVVLDACDTGSAPTNEYVTGLAGSLVDAGILAAIATTRKVYVEPSAIFTREFYSSLVDGYSLEAAAVEARKALSAEDWDWSPYALFVSNTKNLTTFRLVPSPTRPRREPASRMNVAGVFSGQSSLRRSFTSPQKAFETGYALIMGTGGDLPSTIDDAKTMAEILTSPEWGGYPSTQVQVLLDRAANRDSILQEMGFLMHNTRADSTVVVYFSGRGYRVVSGQRARYYLLPHDYDPSNLEHGSIPVREFAQRLRSIPARKLLVLLDCAHAGGMIEEIALEIGFNEGLLGADSTEQGKVVIAAAKDTEMVYAGRPYSAFTQAVLEALSGAQRPMRDTYIRVLDLAAYVQEVVPQRTNGRQHPVVHIERSDNFAIANAPVRKS